MTGVSVGREYPFPLRIQIPHSNSATMPKIGKDHPLFRSSGIELHSPACLTILLNTTNFKALHATPRELELKKAIGSMVETVPGDIFNGPLFSPAKLDGLLKAIFTNRVNTATRLKGHVIVTDDSLIDGACFISGEPDGVPEDQLAEIDPSTLISKSRIGAGNSVVASQLIDSSMEGAGGYEGWADAYSSFRFARLEGSHLTGRFDAFLLSLRGFVLRNTSSEVPGMTNINMNNLSRTHNLVAITDNINAESGLYPSEFTVFSNLMSWEDEKIKECVFRSMTEKGADALRKKGIDPELFITSIAVAMIEIRKFDPEKHFRLIALLSGDKDLNAAHLLGRIRELGGEADGASA